LLGFLRQTAATWWVDSSRASLTPEMPAASDQQTAAVTTLRATVIRAL
jgi:hypothetical protein